MGSLRIWFGFLRVCGVSEISSLSFWVRVEPQTTWRFCFWSLWNCDFELLAPYCDNAVFQKPLLRYGVGGARQNILSLHLRFGLEILGFWSLWKLEFSDSSCLGSLNAWIVFLGFCTVWVVCVCAGGVWVVGMAQHCVLRLHLHFWSVCLACLDIQSLHFWSDSATIHSFIDSAASPIQSILLCPASLPVPQALLKALGWCELSVSLYTRSDLEFSSILGLECRR